MPGREMPPREWKTGCMTMWCPGIAYGEMVQHKHAPEDIPCHNHCFGGFLCLNFGGPFTICLANRAIREKEGIDGNVFTDLIGAVFCGGCSMCRQGRELDLHDQEHHEVEKK